MQITYLKRERKADGYGHEHTIQYRSIMCDSLNDNIATGAVIRIDNIIYTIETMRLVSARYIKLWLTVHNFDNDIQRSI